MFDVGFSELLVIAVVALLVLGPERLPKAARFAGLWVRKARSHWNSVKAEFENELAAEDLQRTLRETREALASAQAELRGGAAALQTQFNDAQAELHQAHAQLENTARQATLPLEPTAPPAQFPEPYTAAVPAHAPPEQSHPEMTRSQVDHALLEPPPPVDEDDDGIPAVPPPDAPPAIPKDPGAHSDAGR